jgi:thioesterase domain-containing protein
VSVAAFLSELRRRDIQVWVDGDQLRCNARTGALTPELRDELRQRKGDIVEFLRSAEAVSKQQRAIVPLQQNGSRVPVFAVPGHNGDVFCYRALAQSLGDQQPFFGLQPPGLDGQSEPLQGVEALAAYFAAQVREFQPRGPYIIAGFCAGGAIAFELAQQLRAGGQAIAFLALFGSPYPGFFRPWTQFRRWAMRQPELLARQARKLAGKPLSESLRYLARKMRRQETPTLDPVLLLRAKVEQANLSAVRAYAPRPYDGTVCLFLPCREWQHAGFLALRWQSVARRSEEYSGPEGCNGDNMLLARNAPAFAELFQRAYIKNVN